MIYLIFVHQVLKLIGVCRLKTNKHPKTLFIVHMNTSNMEKVRETFCIGLNDVHNFVEEQKRIIGKENYFGYNTQAVKLSNYAIEVIKRGVENIDV